MLLSTLYFSMSSCSEQMALLCSMEVVILAVVFAPQGLGKMLTMAV